MADDWLDDASCDPEAQETARRRILSNDFRKAGEARYKTAFRESLQDAREDEQCLQAGLDAGYDDAARAARIRGRARGCLQLLIAFADSGRLRIERSMVEQPSTAAAHAPVEIHGLGSSASQGPSMRQRLLDMATRLSQLRWPQQEALLDEEAERVLQRAGLVSPPIMGNTSGTDSAETGEACGQQADDVASANTRPMAVSGASQHGGGGSTHATFDWRPSAAATSVPHLELLLRDVRLAEALMQDVLGNVPTVSSTVETLSPATIEAFREEVREIVSVAENLLSAAKRSASC